MRRRAGIGVFRRSGATGNGAHSADGQSSEATRARSPDERPRRSEPRVFLMFLRWMLPFWDKALLVLLISMLSATISLLPPWINKYLIDEAIPNRDWSVFYAVFIGLLGMGLMNRVIGTVNSITNRYVHLRVSLALKRRFFDHLQHLSMTFIDNRGIGEHMYRASADIDAVMRMITDILPAAIRAVYEFILILAFTTFLSPSVTVIILLYSIPYTMAAHWLATRVRRLDRAARERWQARDAGLQEGIANVDTVKVFGRQRHEIKRQIDLTVAGFRAEMRLFFVRNMTQRHVINGILPYLKGTLVRAYFLVQVIRGRLTYGSVFPILDYMNRLTNPIQQLVGYFQDIRVAMIPAERILETLDVRPRVTERPHAVPMPPLQGEIRFENVTFQYEDGRGVLNDLSFEIPSGQRIAIVGHSGAGKSTIASLLLRLYDPTDGRVVVDGVDLREVKLCSYQQQLGLVLQDTHLFLGSIRENLLFSNPRATEEELERAAKLADVHDFIASLPDGYDQDLKEGTQLSAAERQRLGIARALLRDPRILLLDEPTSSLDSQSERRVRETLRKAAEGRTTILITHRLNTVADADEIWVMAGGRIVERGTHAELLAQRGDYCRMYALYFGLVDRSLIDEPEEGLVGAVGC